VVFTVLRKINILIVQYYGALSNCIEKSLIIYQLGFCMYHQQYTFVSAQNL